MKTMIFEVLDKDERVEINIESLKEDKKLWKAIQDGKTVWVKDYVKKENGDAEFTFKVLNQT